MLRKRNAVYPSISRCKYHNTRTIAAAASLRPQQQQLTLQLANVLQQQDVQQADRVDSAAQLVNKGVAALLASPDWLQLQHTFQLAARQRNSAAAAARQVVNAAAASGTSNSSIDTSRPAGSSPWGFALRQPKPQPAGQPVQPSTSSVGPMAPSASLQQQQQQQQAQWDWAGVQQFMVLGQGSIGRLYASSSDESTSSVRHALQLSQVHHYCVRKQLRSMCPVQQQLG
jgi:hypothetical protein